MRLWKKTAHLFTTTLYYFLKKLVWRIGCGKRGKRRPRRTHPKPWPKSHKEAPITGRKCRTANGRPSLSSSRRPLGVFSVLYCRVIFWPSLRKRESFSLSLSHSGSRSSPAETAYSVSVSGFPSSGGSHTFDSVNSIGDVQRMHSSLSVTSSTCFKKETQKNNTSVWLLEST